MERIWMREAVLRAGGTLLSFTWTLSVFLLFSGAGGLAATSSKWQKIACGRRLGFSLALWGAVAVLCHCGRELLFATALELGGGWQIFVVLLAGPSCFAAGIAFPWLLELGIEKAGTGRTSGAGPVYASNLLGSAAGALLGGLLIPWFWGFAATFIAVSATLIVAGACLAWRSPRDTAYTEQIYASTLPKTVVPPANVPFSSPSLFPSFSTFGVAPSDNAIAVAAVLLSSFLTMGLEIVFFAYLRLLSLDSFVSSPSALAAFILGLGAGAMHAAWRRQRGILPGQALADAGLAGAAILLLYVPMLSLLTAYPQAGLPNIWAHLAKTLGLSLLFVLPLLCFVGAIYPLAWDLLAPHEQRASKVFGLLAAVGATAGAAGALLVPYGLLPTLGLNRSTLLIGVGYLLLALLPRGGCRGWRAWIGVATAACLAIAFAFFPRPTMPLQPGEQVLHYRQGRNDAVAVIEDAVGSRHIVLNHTYTLNGTGRAMLHQLNESFLPLILHPQPRRMLFIGMGSGISADAALEFPLERMVAAELVPEVVDVAREYFSPWNRRVFDSPIAEALVADGRSLVRASPRTFDVVVCDLFHPGIDGAERMYSRDFFMDARRSLRPGGLFCIWLPCHQLDTLSIGIITRTFIDVFPYALAFRANMDAAQPIIGYMGSSSPFDLSAAHLSRRLGVSPATELAARSPYLRSVENFHCSLMMDLHANADRFLSFPLNTEDRPSLAYAMGGGRIGAGRLTGMKLLEWLGRRQPSPHFPSLCHLADAEEAANLVAGIRAGNYYYAASCALAMASSKHIGTRTAAEADMVRRLMDYLGMARSLSPRSNFSIEEICQ